MKKLLFLLLMFSTSLFAQKQVTKFMGIPVDGFKKDMIQKLEDKGFEYDRANDYFTGEFNGEKVNIYVLTNNNKIWRIAVADVNYRDEAQIRVRFNNLCYQFKNNKRYTSIGDEEQTIPETEDIGYEISVNNKQYQAYFFQESEDDTKEDVSKIFNQVMKEKYGLNVETLLQVIDGKDVDASKIDTTSLREFMKEAEIDLDDLAKMDSAKVNNYLEEKTKKFMVKLIPDLLKKKYKELSMRNVWFNIFRNYGKYSLMIFYDNEYNKANGEDL